MPMYRVNEPLEELLRRMRLSCQSEADAIAECIEGALESRDDDPLALAQAMADEFIGWANEIKKLRNKTMSRYYSMSVVITDFQADHAEAIRNAASMQWDFCDWYDLENRLSASGDGSLCGGEAEDEFSKRLVQAVWKANKGFCIVTVGCTYMENLPYEEYEFDDYQNFVKNEKEK